MNAAPALFAYAAVVGTLAPGVMVRCRWPQRSPSLAIGVWFTLAVTFSLSLSLAALNLGDPDAHLHGLVYSCRAALGLGPSADGALARAGVAFSVVLVVAHLVGFTFHAVRAHAARSGHREVLDKVGRRSADLDATVVEHAVPAAYCLPGRQPRIVLSTGAVDLLSGAELGAVVEHERAHVLGRHHLVLSVSHALTWAFPGLPLARQVRGQVPLLLEMAADDRALRRFPRTTVATAMFTMASGEAPQGALAAGGQTVLVRLKRVLGPARAAHPVLRCCVGASAVVAPLLPVLLVCPAGLG
ncbi:M56 family metallopeptidase [Streptomyces microflavus]|uniref:M56 family metallopeptidase n=1 Tax=Streptomyces microflavus TaxID=1919 RepID=UPI0029A58B3D|nr:M56 family metallopeptidase [Streptomyces microflavus]MDX2406205.1 M56 family metallopeptidase [Streptomyces microflavus]